MAGLAGLAACGPAESKGASAAGASQASSAGTPAPSADAASAAPPAGSAGAAGSPCTLPVAFDLAQDWKPKAVTHAGDEEFAALFKQGGTTLACEIDAKPAGHLGFLRVWVADTPTAAGDARRVLEAFMAGEKAKGAPAYADLRAGTGDSSLPAVEARYETAPLDEPKKERALAVVTPGGKAVVLQLGGFDTAEHDAMLPAYRMAVRSLRPTG
ncbi:MULTISPECIES: lipoprotein [Streptomyces]|uniref:lipoprotein n=1 Tax=Streptomyces TaxID=1883 RepID=UPI001FE61C85|nr:MULTISPECIES: lipoprotein [Streptomyces]